MGGDIGVKATQSPGGGEVPAGGCGGATFFFEVPLLTIPEEEVEAAHAAAVLDANALAVALGAGLPPRGGGHGGPNLLAGGAEIHSPRPPAAVRNARVLIVDDNRVNLLIVERVVRRLHMVPVLASDGGEARRSEGRRGMRIELNDVPLFVQPWRSTPSDGAARSAGRPSISSSWTAR